MAIFIMMKTQPMEALSYYKNREAMTDAAIVKDICKGLKQMRLNKNISQQELADLSGLSRITISRMEAGRAATLLTVVQILKALGMLDILNAFNQEPAFSAINLAELPDKPRKKATPRQFKK